MQMGFVCNYIDIYKMKNIQIFIGWIHFGLPLLRTEFLNAAGTERRAHAHIFVIHSNIGNEICIKAKNCRIDIHAIYRVSAYNFINRNLAH